MKSKTLLHDRIESGLIDAVRSCQAGVIDTFELELGESPNWKSVRGRLLRCFGDRGLQARISEVLAFEFGRGEK